LHDYGVATAGLSGPPQPELRSMNDLKRPNNKPSHLGRRTRCKQTASAKWVEKQQGRTRQKVPSERILAWAAFKPDGNTRCSAAFAWERGTKARERLAPRFGREL
jgi:hypothetical protein